jgi:hypothetical protein
MVVKLYLATYLKRIKVKMKILRKCPCCGNKGVDINELFTGAHCLYCTCLIEVNSLYSYGLSIILCGLSILFFKLSLLMLGTLTLVGLLFYTSSYKYLISRYLPLKNYS